MVLSDELSNNRTGILTIPVLLCAATVAKHTPAPSPRQPER